MAVAQRWGQLRFVHHADEVGWDDSMFSWIPDIAISQDPDRWHPLDALFAPLIAVSGELLGVLSVDLPVDGRIPGPHQLEMLSLFADHATIAIEHARMHAELQTSRDNLAYAATHDPLTGLNNRTILSTRALTLARTPDSHLAVLVLDLDDFKSLNDSKGHRAGDDLLGVLAQRMRGCVRSTDVLARIGGDEFVVVLAGNDAAPAVADLATRLDAALNQPMRGSDWRPPDHRQHGHRHCLDPDRLRTAARRRGRGHVPRQATTQDNGRAGLGHSRHRSPGRNAAATGGNGSEQAGPGRARPVGHHRSAPLPGRGGRAAGTGPAYSVGPRAADRAGVPGVAPVRDRAFRRRPGRRRTATSDHGVRDRPPGAVTTSGVSRTVSSARTRSSRSGSCTTSPRSWPTSAST